MAVEKKKIILVVEDNKIVQTMMKKNLETFTEYRIVQAKDGQDGMRKAEELGDQIAFILLDFAMPNKRGEDFIQELRQKKEEKLRDIITIGVTGNQNNWSKEELKNMGINAVMIKPVDFNRLLMLLKKLENAQKDAWEGVIF